VWYGKAPYIPQPPPEPPELPEGASPWPRWPWWYGPVAFLAAQIAGLIVGGVVFAAFGTDDIDEPAPLIVATVFLDILLVGSALLFASWTKRPTARDFGFRRTRFWPAFGWSALTFFSFILLAGIYSALVEVEEQTTIDDLGADESQTALVVSAVLVIVVAPLVEEFFFRGFFYRALRSKLPALVAAAVVGVVFGLVHITSGVDAIPVLVVLGIALCLLYEVTGSLYPVIALHAFNNAIAYGAGTEEPALSAGLGFVMIAACVLLPRLTASPRPAVATG
jgi:membrane protease YdiL (CAAX protease family)